MQNGDNILVQPGTHYGKLQRDLCLISTTKIFSNYNTVASFSSSVSSPFLISSRFLPPVRISLPEEKMRTTIFGSLIRYTSPGNCSGSYSIFSRLSVTLNLLILMYFPRL